jgi:hypothetical protein
MWANAAFGLMAKERAVKRVKQRNIPCPALKSILQKIFPGLRENFLKYLASLIEVRNENNSGS